jgi:anti-anti-sigma factor
VSGHNSTGRPDVSEHHRPSGDLLSVRVESASSDIPVLTLGGELDLSTIAKVERRLLGQVRSHPALVVDLTNLSFIDSSGIGLLIRAFRSTEDRGAMHLVIAPGSQVARVFRLAGIDRVLHLFADRNAAIDALDGRRNGAALR